MKLIAPPDLKVDDELLGPGFIVPAESDFPPEAKEAFAALHNLVMELTGRVLDLEERVRILEKHDDH